MYFNKENNLYSKIKINKLLKECSYKKSQLVFQNYSKSYYLGAMFFNYREFKQICALYSFLRIIDNIIDSQININIKKEKLKRFRDTFFKCYSEFKEYYGNINIILKYEWDEYKDYIISIMDTFYKLNIEDELLNKFFDSMNLDLIKFEYENFQELMVYMDGSAGIVGEIMYLIMTQNNIKKKNSETNKYARDLGVAFQLTNFIRDINEDRNMYPYRIYLPIDEQKKFNINLIYNNYDENLIEFIKYQIDRNIEYYNLANKGINKLDYNYRNGIIVAKNMGLGILNKIKKNDYNVFNEENNLTKYEKCDIVYEYISIYNIFILIRNYLLYNYIYFYFF